MFKKRKKINNELQSIGLSIKAYNSLRNIGINTLAELAMYSREQLYQIRGIGEVNFKKIEKAIENQN